MTRRALIGLVLLGGAWMPAFAQDLSSAKLRVQWAEFKKLYDARAAIVVDVRAPESFEAGHIPGALNVPLDQVQRRAAELKKSGKPVLIYCA